MKNRFKKKRKKKNSKYINHTMEMSNLLDTTFSKKQATTSLCGVGKHYNKLKCTESPTKTT